MKRHISILFLACACMGAHAQTPFDSFAPATSRPMLELESTPAADTVLYVIVKTLLTSDNIRKWLSVDPMADKYPNISPYAYCGWNPLNAIDPDGRIVQVFDADGVTALYNTLNTSDCMHVSIDEQGYVAIDKEHILNTSSNNYTALAELAGSNTNYTIATGNSFEYKNEAGVILTGNLPPVLLEPGYGPDGFGFDTNETGWLGVTQTPGAQPDKYNSLDNSVHVLLNSTLSTEGKAQILSHELYGHALLYQRGQPHTHNVRGGIEQNSVLRDAITTAISETKQNMRGR